MKKTERIEMEPIPENECSKRAQNSQNVFWGTISLMERTKYHYFVLLPETVSTEIQSTSLESPTVWVQFREICGLRNYVLLGIGSVIF